MVIVPEKNLTIQELVDSQTKEIDCIWVKDGHGNYVVASGSAPILRYEVDEWEDDEDAPITLYIWVEDKYVLRYT